MITIAEAAKLAVVHTVHPRVLSLYLTVPADPAGLCGLPARADDLIAAAESACAGRWRVADEERSLVRDRLETSGRDWPGRTVAVFACADAGLSEAFPLPCRVPDLAVLGVRPHVRPLLAAMQRCPGHLAGQVAATPPGGLAATGLQACLAAVNAGAVQTLIVPEDGLVPGYECGRCGDLTVEPDECPDWGTAALPVPDVIDEMVSRTLEDGGKVCLLHDGPSRIAARLRFAVAT